MTGGLVEDEPPSLFLFRRRRRPGDSFFEERSRSGQCTAWLGRAPVFRQIIGAIIRGFRQSRPLRVLSPRPPPTDGAAPPPGSPNMALPRFAWLVRWLERHRHPASFWLHMVGIPLTVAAAGLAVVQLWYGLWGLWWRPVALLVGGYLLQWLGHRIEGNDMGEVIFVKKRLGKPYVAVSPAAPPREN